MRTRYALLALSLVASPAAARAATVWTALASEKIRPSAQARDVADVRISAARNEFEAFQVVVTGAATNVRAEATPLAGPSAIPVRLYRAATITVKTPSALDGAIGPWPDALVPDVDEQAGERRNAFPFNAAAGESRAIWAEVLVPQDAAPGEYTGSVRVTWDGGAATVPVSLTVFPFALPSTASLKSAFGFTWSALPAAHGVGGSGDAFSALRARYGNLALDHRLSLSKIDDGNRDLAHFTAFFAPQFDGASRTALPGAKLTAIEYLGGDSAYGSWTGLFADRGWFDRLFQYTCDEPPLTCAWSDIPVRARAAKAANPAFRTLVTTNIDEADARGVTSSIDIMTPVVNFMDDKPGARFAGNQRAKYDAFLASGPQKELWMYQSCMSHGCGGTVNMGSPSDSDRYYSGWPSYMIDASAVRNRAMEWLSFRYRATGELYYEAAMAFDHDPWSDQWDFSGNGDGTLFYPGTPAKIGGTTHVAVASIRLKMIREGMEDYEYLKLVSDLGDDAFAREVADGLFPNAYATEVAPEKLMAARARLAQRIVELRGGDTGVVGAGDVGAGDGAAVVVGPPGGGGCHSGGAGLAALLGLALATTLRRRRT